MKTTERELTEDARKALEAQQVNRLVAEAVSVWSGMGFSCSDSFADVVGDYCAEHDVLLSDGQLSMLWKLYR